MDSRTAIKLSLALNLALAATACWLGTGRAPAASGTLARQAITNALPGAGEPPQTNFNWAPRTSARPFHWSMIESEEYSAYIANLRGIECPELTIRDIIRADVSDLFVRQRQALLEPIQRQFWDYLSRDPAQRHDDELQEKVERLKEDKRKLLQQLLGDPAEGVAPKPRRSFPGAHIEFLSEGKQDQVTQLLEKYNQLRREMQPQAGQSIGPEQRERLKALAQQQEDELKQLLAPQEYDEYKLRRSSGVRVAQNLYGFEPTDEEFHTIARLQMNFEEGLRQAGRPAALDRQTILEARQRAKSQLEEELKGALGEGRFALFKRASDPRFQEIYRVARRYDLPDEMAVRVYGIRESAEQAADRLRQNAGLGEDQRVAALEAIEEETERAIAENFGLSGLKTYQRYGGSWLEAMAELPDDGNLAEESDDAE